MKGCDMTDLAARFEQHRDHLTRVAYRMLGSLTEAEDAVQEAWLRLGRSDAEAVANLGGWLTTVVARVCLDELRARRARREQALDEFTPEPIVRVEEEPEEEAVLADSVGAALLVVLDTLTPAERLAFVLHDMFDVPFDEIAPIIGRTPVATRKLASRARNRVQGGSPDSAADVRRRRAVVTAFLQASRSGDFDGLLALLDPNAVARADATVTSFGGAVPEVRGAAEVADNFTGRAQAARPALIDGEPGAIWMQGGQVRVVF